MSTINPLVFDVLAAGGSVWVSSYKHNIGSNTACTNIRATEVTKKTGYWRTLKGKYLPSFKENECIHPTREAAIAHYNQSIDDSLAAMHRIVDGLAPSLMKKKYKV